jgi:hypothetical protein
MSGKPRSDEPEKAWQSDDYSQARANFLAACVRAGVPVDSHVHPLTGPDGEELATDVARFGPADAGKLLVMVSGVHGVEGFSGSAAQVGWIEEQRYLELPGDTAVLMIHLINPWGVAHLRRYTEDNVDLCRNFLDFDKPLPDNPQYAEIHKVLAPGEKLGEQGQKIGPYLAELVAERGVEQVVDLFMGGQYQFDDGFGFGGKAPVWSNTTLRKILGQHNGRARRVCAIEFHTGLGPWAYGTLITMHTGSALERVRAHFGGWVVSPAAREEGTDEVYYQVRGHSIHAYEASFPDACVTAVTLEFGTYPPDATLVLMLQEHLLVHSESQEPEVLQKVKAQLREYHHPRDWEWRCAFWTRSLQLIRQALRCLENTKTG